MNRDLWRRIHELLPAVRALPAGEREAFLSERCAGQPELVSELRRLLETPPPDFLEAPSVELPAERAGLAPGRRIAEFEIVRELGRGGMGVVYLARQPSLGRLVALKVVPASLFPEDERLSRFRVEALAAARLQHPSIVHVISAGQHEGYRYIAMEYIDGADLALVIEAEKLGRAGHANMPRFDAPGYARRAAEVVRSIAEALEYAHKNGILHRDVKPQNILLDLEGKAWLVDFGLAKDLGAASISVSGQILGTPYYMSPEQALARRVDIDHRTDVFSLGAVLYELLTLERPFGGDTLRRVLNAISFSDPVGVRRRNPRVHRDLETICFKALEKAPERRFPTARAFADELGRFLANEPLSIRRSWPVERLVRRVRRNRAASALGIVLLGVLLLVPLLPGLVRAAELADVIQRAERVLADPASDADALRAVLVRLQDAAEESLDEASAERVAAAIEAIRGRGRAHKERWRAALERGLPDEGLPGFGQADAALEQARRHLFEARLLLPEDEELAAAPDLALPTVTLVDVPPGLQVSMRVIDPRTGVRGARQTLGTTPLENLPLRRGYFSFEIEDGSRLCELTRLLDRPGARHVLRPRLLPVAEVTRGMVALPASRIECDYVDRGHVALELEPFWIDASEVSIGQFRAYLRASGHPPPKAWTIEKFRARCEELLQPGSALDTPTPWDDHPIAGIAYEEARAYAEWHGKRLPDVFELDFAARGSELRRYPWTSASVLDLAELREHARLDFERTAMDPNAPRRDVLSDYLERTVPVGSMPQGRSAFGLFHTYGNVKEWTATLFVQRRHEEPGAEVLVADPTTVLIRGKGWDSSPGRSGEAFGLEHFDRIPTSYAPFSLGFRCVRSAR